MIYFHPIISSSTYLFIHIFIHPSIYLSIYLFIHLSIYPSIFSSIYLFVHLSIHSSIYSSIYPSIHLYIYLVRRLSNISSLYLEQRKTSFGQTSDLQVSNRHQATSQSQVNSDILVGILSIYLFSIFLTKNDCFTFKIKRIR